MSGDEREQPSEREGASFRFECPREGAGEQEPEVGGGQRRGWRGFCVFLR